MKTIMIKCYIYISRFIYFFIKLLPVENKIVMISRQSNHKSIDFQLLGDKLEKEYKVIYLCKVLKAGINAELKDKFNYFAHSLRQMYHLSTSKVCILDSYCPTVSILKHKKKLTVIQMWHSIGTMKKFGYAILGTEEGTKVKIAKLMHMHENYNIIFVASKAYQNHLMQGFNCSKNKFLVKTLPRVDLLLDKNYEKNTRDKILKEYPQLKNKKNVLYCPTFRKNEKKFTKAINDLIENIDYSKYNLIIKLHPLSKVRIVSDKAIVDNKFSTFEMLNIADKVISDYSCIIYEAGIKNVPLYFYDFDIKEYEIKRGLVIDYNELPGYTRGTAKELIKTLELKYDYQYLKKFINKYITNKKDCTKEIVKIIKSYMK